MGIQTDVARSPKLTVGSIYKTTEEAKEGLYFGQRTYPT
jgi:hypothetical protein